MWLGPFAIGAGLALPYASAPRIALATLPNTQAGKGSGMLNRELSRRHRRRHLRRHRIRAGRFPGVLVVIGLSALIGAALSLAVRP